MNLRNKKTGEVVGLSIFGIELNIRKENQPIYHSLAALNEEWEDYAPKEPLIKDEKIRKAIRAWADVNDIETADYDDYFVSFRRDDKTISFKDEDNCLGFYGLEDNKNYTIDELCGEEE